MTTRCPYGNQTLHTPLSPEFALEAAGAIDPNLRAIIKRCDAAPSPLRIVGGQIRTSRANASYLYEMTTHDQPKHFVVTPRGAQMANIWKSQRL